MAYGVTWGESLINDDMYPPQRREREDFFMAAISERPRSNTNLYSLDPNSPLRVREDLFLDHTDPRKINPRRNIEFVKSLGHMVPTPEGTRRFVKGVEHTQWEQRRAFLFQALEVSSDADLLELIHNTKERRRRVEGNYPMLGRMYGIEGKKAEVKRTIEGYGSLADATVQRAKSKVLGSKAGKFEMTNEVQSTNNPFELMLMAADNRFDKKVRFEAVRKLMLMDLIASIDQKERRLNTVAQFDKFIAFLDEHVWNPKQKKGASTPGYLISQHDEAHGFVATKVAFVDEKEGDQMLILPGQKRTALRRRSFLVPQGDGEKEIFVYASERRKLIEDEALKLVRGGAENPDIVIEDQLGLEVVFDNESHLRLFMRHLHESAKRAGSFMAIEDLEDSLNNGTGHNGTSEGSSSKLRMRKFYIKMNGMRVEIILHTNETYVNSLYAEQVAHKEYEVNRFFRDNKGVPSAAKQLFPEYVYGQDLDSIHEQLTYEVRRSLQDPFKDGPPLEI